MTSMYVIIMLVGLVAAPAQDGGPPSGPRAESSSTLGVPEAHGWLNWRGPSQNGASGEAGLPDRYAAPSSASPAGENHLWAIDLAGRGTPVIAQFAHGDRVLVAGYRGTNENLREVLVCLAAESGQTIWERGFSDFISDIIYNRYSIGSPAVDPQTGNIYWMTSPGLLVCFDRDGKRIWERSLMEEFGRLTFPNGRTGAPAIDGGLVIINVITTNWGREGPARNRFYAFDNRTGELVWSSTPGVGPPFLKDSSFSSPVFGWQGGKRVFYAGTGCGNIVCVNARTGEPIWRYQFAVGGVNASVVLHGDHLIAIHGKENVDDTGRGRMAALKVGAEPAPGAKGPVVLDQSYEVWRNDGLSMFTSSPTLVGDRVYQCTAKGDLVCVNANTGEILWSKQLGTSQLHASPLYADGKLYVPMWQDGLYIIRPTDEGAEILDHVELKGASIGSPAVWNGRIYIHTTEKLYCFGRSRSGTRMSPAVAGSEEQRFSGTQIPSRLQVVPAEIVLRPGEKVSFELRELDQVGQLMGMSNRVRWRKFIPASARVRAYLDAGFNDTGELVAAAGARRSAGAFECESSQVKGYFRGRILPSPPYAEDFESFNLNHTNKLDGVNFAYPPLPWIGARLKWEVRVLEGNNVLAKTLDRVLFQRSMVFIGHPDDHKYTVSVDVMSDGSRRGMGTAGLINQRYLFILDGNKQIVEVSSNHDRVKISVPFAWRPKTWYRLKTRVDVQEDGWGMLRAKAWESRGPEPGPWQLEARVPNAHHQGSPGLFGFSPQSRFRVYIDNIEVEPND